METVTEVGSDPTRSVSATSPLSPSGPGVSFPAYCGGQPIAAVAFGLTMATLSLVNANWLDATTLGFVLPVASAVGGLGMLVAGVWEARTGNEFGATWTLGFGVFWLSIAGILQFTVPTVGKAVSAPHFYHAFGAYLLLWAGVGVVLTVAARFVGGALTAVFLIATVTLAILGAAFLDVSGSSFATIRHVAGYVGLLDGVVALYVAAALVVADTTGQAVLPLFPHARPAA
jgi:uncharacterized protein